jgi:hypothetical protein
VAVVVCVKVNVAGDGVVVATEDVRLDGTTRGVNCTIRSRRRTEVQLVHEQPRREGLLPKVLAGFAARDRQRAHGVRQDAPSAVARVGGMA